MEQIATIGRNVKAIKTSRYSSYLSPKQKPRTMSYSFTQIKDSPNAEFFSTSDMNPEFENELRAMQERLQEIQSQQEKHSQIISESTKFYDVMKDILC